MYNMFSDGINLKDQLPEYYEQIKLPISIGTIEDKLESRRYKTVSQIESDIKRMVVNAKEYNMPKSEIHDDAERIRKLAFNFMKANNPAYKRDSNYTAEATPLPDESPVEKTTKLRLTAPSKKTSAPETVKVSSDTATPRSESAKPKEEPAQADDARPAGDYKGLSFQRAQDKIVDELIDYVEPESGLQVFLPFVNLPSRSLKDYYAVIKYPTSLKGIKKKIQGWHSRDEQTGSTDFTSWAAFENEVARIWDNAKEYNEDGSEMHLTADEFEVAFKQRLKEAKKVVEEPQQTKLKLNMGDAKLPANSSLKLKLGSRKPSPAPTSSSTLQPTSGSPTGSKPTLNGVAASTLPTGSRARSTASPAIPAKTPNGIPASTPQATQVNGIMPPPSTAARPTSSSYTHPTMPPPSLAPPPHYTPPSYHQPTNTFDSKWRPKAPTKADGSPGDPDILMSKLHISTHPDIPATNPFRVTVPASNIMSQQSVTATLSAQHAVVRITAELADQLKGSNARMYRLFVSNNGVRQSQRVIHDYAHLPNGMVNGAYGAVKKDTTKGPSYDVRMQPGTNRIEVECVAAAKQGSGNNHLVMEKVSLFVFQLKT